MKRKPRQEKITNICNLTISTHQLSFQNVGRKVDYHAGGKWFIYGPKRRKEN